MYILRYVGVDESEDVQLFYYFAKSDLNPREDPLVLWLTGGPGCSSFTGFAYEVEQDDDEDEKLKVVLRSVTALLAIHTGLMAEHIKTQFSANEKPEHKRKKCLFIDQFVVKFVGPLNFKAVQDSGSLPTVVTNPNSWTKGASMIFVDLPVGTGFSYPRTSAAAHSTDLQTCAQAYEFMRKWLIDHPEFISNLFYLAGDSYSGITVPTVAHLISDGNEVGNKPFINLKGYVLGNPVTFLLGDGNYAIPFAHGMGLISDELYESLQRNCEGEYMNVDPSNVECSNDVEAYSQCISGIQTAQILEPLCGFASPKPHQFFSERRSLDDDNTELLLPEQSPCASNRVDGYRLSYRWLDDDGVREALGVRKVELFLTEGSIGPWIRCNFSLPYISTITDSYQYHVKLSTKGYSSGDHDLIVPFLGTQAWIKSLNYSIVDDWRSWTVEGQVAGYTRSYSNGMTYATVKA
ncbi:hypothetical protein RHSIM_Rhsim06G0063200 [Rhododendron simsii]|uniref:Serine carboxypeptidase-like 18 n=1 Tax=Rhododendron simsii TaxID=118357 RepID=A0A834GTM0_RHOSS|nr:hypothetical protein RHSIM_Rhsim06G0063200 [Rhododendron simsii]